MKDLNYQYKIIDEKNIKGRLILKVKDDIYNKTVYLEEYKKTDLNNWEDTYKVEQELEKMKSEGKIDNYYAHDEFIKNIKIFYKIYDSFPDFDETEKTSEKDYDKEKTKKDYSNEYTGESENLFQNFNDSFRTNENKNQNYSFYEEKKVESEGETKYETYTKTITYNTSDFPQDDLLKKAEEIIKQTISEIPPEELEKNTIKNSKEITYQINKETRYRNTPRSFSKNPQTDKQQKRNFWGNLIFFALSVSIYLFFSKEEAPQKITKDNYSRGIQYYNKRDFLKAVRYLSKACLKENNPKACKKTAYIYNKSLIDSENKQKVAVRFYKKGCELKNEDSCYALYKILKNKKEKLKYVINACKLGNFHACSEAGFFLETEFKNIAEAKIYYDTACKNNIAVSCYNLGLVYKYEKIKGMKDEKKAYDLFLKSCNKGYQKACEFIKNNVDTSIKKLKETSEKQKENLSDNPENLYKKGYEYQNKKDYYNANLFFQKACSKGHILSCDYLGYNYREGFGFNKSIIMAQKYFMEDCEKGSGYACNQIGYFYDTGKGFEKNHKTAGKYYKKACNLKNALGCYNLALLFEYGRGYKKDIKSAEFLYKKSCKLGEKSACKKIKK